MAMVGGAMDSVGGGYGGWQMGRWQMILWMTTVDDVDGDGGRRHG